MYLGKSILFAFPTFLRIMSDTSPTVVRPQSELSRTYRVRYIYRNNVTVPMPEWL